MPKKLEEIKNAILRTNPGYGKSKAWAAATVTYKKWLKKHKKKWVAKGRKKKRNIKK